MVAPLRDRAMKSFTYSSNHSTIHSFFQVDRASRGGGTSKGGGISEGTRDAGDCGQGKREGRARKASQAFPQYPRHVKQGEGILPQIIPMSTSGHHSCGKTWSCWLLLTLSLHNSRSGVKPIGSAGKARGQSRVRHEAQEGYRTKQS